MGNTKEEKRESLLPLLSAKFAEVGFRRATTAQLAKSCGVQETILYRLWPGKKEMFVDSIDYITENLISVWQNEAGKYQSPAESLKNLLNYESEHFGELGNYIIIFSGLNDADDPDIKGALSRMYFRIHSFLVELITKYRVAAGKSDNIDVAMQVWSLIGLGTMITITKRLGLLSDADRQRLMNQMGGFMLGV